MTYLASISPAVVDTASPVGRPLGYLFLRMARHASSISKPPARWIAPSTPPPPIRELLAALTMAQTFSLVMSAVLMMIFGCMMAPMFHLSNIISII